MKLPSRALLIPPWLIEREGHLYLGQEEKLDVKLKRASEEGFLFQVVGKWGKEHNPRIPVCLSTDVSRLESME